MQRLVAVTIYARKHKALSHLTHLRPKALSRQPTTAKAEGKKNKKKGSPDRLKQ